MKLFYAILALVLIVVVLNVAFEVNTQSDIMKSHAQLLVKQNELLDRQNRLLDKQDMLSDGDFVENFFALERPIAQAAADRSKH